MSENSNEQFDYGGELVFNGIVRTDVQKDSPQEFRSKILEKLPKFKRGSPGNAGSGRVELQLERLAEEHNLSDELANIASNLLTVEYRYESYSRDPIEVVEYDDGEPKHTHAYPRRLRSAFLYWDYPKTIFFQGAQTRVDEVAPKINSLLGDDVGFEYLGFDKEFFLWLVLKDKHSEPLTSRMHVEALKSSEITGGDPADFGKDAEVEESDDISQSLPILAGVLKDMDISMLEGDFKVNGYKVNAKIFSSGRVRLYANRDLANVSKLERALISNLFLTELMKEYRNWEGLPDQKKYPHPRYFKELHDEANSSGANFRFDFTSLVHRYAELRGEDPATYDFEFDIYEPDDA